MSPCFASIKWQDEENLSYLSSPGRGRFPWLPMWLRRFGPLLVARLPVPCFGPVRPLSSLPVCPCPFGPAGCLSAAFAFLMFCALTSVLHLSIFDSAGQLHFAKPAKPAKRPQKEKEMESYSNASINVWNAEDARISVLVEKAQSNPEKRPWVEITIARSDLTLFGVTASKIDELIGHLIEARNEVAKITGEPANPTEEEIDRMAEEFKEGLDMSNGQPMNETVI